MHDQVFKSAKDVSNYLLDVTGRAMMANDFAMFATCFHLPHELETFDGTHVMTSEAELRATFDAVHEHFKSLGVTQLVRNCISAEFVAPDKVHATHQTFLMAGDRLRQEPFPSFSILRNFAGHWKVTHSQYAISDAPAHNRALTDPTAALNSLMGEPGK